MIVVFLTTIKLQTMKPTLLSHKGYHGSIEPSLEDGVLHGRVLFIVEKITYQASTISEMQEAFENAVEHYLTSCLERAISPERPFKGQFNVRIAPDLHKSAAIRAEQEQTSLNNVVVSALRQYLGADRPEMRH